MAAPSPIHRDPDADGDDYGCVGRNAAKGNAAIVKLVDRACTALETGEISEGGELISFVRAHLEHVEKHYDCGSCDTIVKENVFAALNAEMEKAGIEIGQAEICGW